MLRFSVYMETTLLASKLDICLMRQRHLDQRVESAELQLLVNRALLHARKLDIKRIQNEMADCDTNINILVQSCMQFCAELIK